MNPIDRTTREARRYTICAGSGIQPQQTTSAASCRKDRAPFGSVSFTRQLARNGVRGKRTEPAFVDSSPPRSGLPGLGAAKGTSQQLCGHCRVLIPKATINLVANVRQPPHRARCRRRRRLHAMLRHGTNLLMDQQLREPYQRPSEQELPSRCRPLKLQSPQRLSYP